MVKLPVISILKDALRTVFQQRLVLLRTLAVSALILAALDTYQVGYLAKDPDLTAIAASFYFYWVAATIFAVTAHRVILLGDSAVPKFGLFGWTWRETRFFGWSLFMVSCIVAFLILVGVTAALLSSAFGIHLAENFSGVEFEFDSPWVLALVPMLLPPAYIASRWALLFPATAVGERRGIGWAWRTTGGNGWRMLVISALLPVLFTFAPGYYLVEYNVAMAYVVILVSYVLLVIGIAALSLSYRFFEASAGNEGGSAVRTK